MHDTLQTTAVLDPFSSIATCSVFAEAASQYETYVNEQHTVTG